MFAHSIKNPHILHAVEVTIDNGISGDKKRIRYLCIQACGITLSKVAPTTDKVTCKNCLKRLEGRELTEPFNDYYRSFPHGPCTNNFKCGGAYVCALTNGLCNSVHEDMRCDTLTER